MVTRSSVERVLPPVNSPCDRGPGRFLRSAVGINASDGKPEIQETPPRTRARADGYGIEQERLMRRECVKEGNDYRRGRRGHSDVMPPDRCKVQEHVALHPVLLKAVENRVQHDIRRDTAGDRTDKR